MMPWSGLPPTLVERACEMGTSDAVSDQHHVGSPALTTDRSMTPGGSRPQGCRFADGDGRACIRLNGLQRVRPDQHARHKPVDPDGPVTEVLSLVGRVGRKLAHAHQQVYELGTLWCRMEVACTRK